MSFPKYPEYKDSGVEWLGVVPAHWKIQPLKFVTTCNDDVLPDSTPADYQLRYVEISDVDEQSGITGWTEHVFASAPSRARRMVRHGDVLISTVRTYLRAIAPVLDPPENLVASTGFAAIRPIPGLFQSGLLGYTLRADWFISNVIARSVGVSYPGINATDLVDLPVPTPSSEEQTVIAAFLDHETARIDALVAEQQLLIELLKEKRQAVISHAVTKGLNPDAPMKDSGVEWLGEVPAHWEISRLKYLGKLITGITPPSEDLTNYSEAGWPWIKPDDLDDQGTPIRPSSFLTDQGWSYCRPVEALSTLVCCIGSIGKLGYTGEVVSTNQQITAIQPFYEARYLFYLLCASKPELDVRATGNVLRILNAERLGNVPAAIPPTDESKEISVFLDHETSCIDSLVKEGESVIQLLQERRSALISAAVTGKIDVRGWQPPPGSPSPTEATATEPA